MLLFQALKEQDDTTSVIVASNLLRAIETITIALADRLVVTGEQIYVRSELQEISRNFDAISLSPPLMLPHTRAIYTSGGNKQTRMNRRSYPHIYTRSQEWLGDRCCIEFPQTRFSSFMAVLRLARATMHRRLTSTSDVLVS